MAERDLVVRLIGDSRSLERAFLRSGRAGRQFDVRMRGVTRSLARGLGFAAAAAGVASFGLALRSTVNAAIDFESSFAGVRKTVDATEPQFEELAKGFRNLSKEIPVSVNELNRIGEAAGQLGIQREAILGFTRTVADLGVTTNLSSDEAATSLARLANITQLPQDQFDRLGASVVELGNKLATTEAEIVGFGLRIAGAGRQVNLTEAQILAIGGAFSSVGVEAERGGTAISKTLLLIQSAVLAGGKKLEEFAEVAGQSADEFKRSFELDAGATFASFIEGLERIRKSGGDAGKALRDLGLSDQRLIQAFLAMAGGGDLLRRSLDLSTKAWEENTALTEEAGKRYETTASQLQKFKNRVNDLQITIGEVLAPELIKIIEPLGDWLENTENQERVQRALISTLKDAKTAIKAVADVVVPLARAIKTAMDNTIGLERAVRLLLVAMVASKIVGFAGAITGLSTQALIATGRVTALRLALLRLGALGVIVLGVELVLNRDKIRKFGADVSRSLDDFFGNQRGVEIPLDASAADVQRIRDAWAETRGEGSAYLEVLDKIIRKLRTAEAVATRGTLQDASDRPSEGRIGKTAGAARARAAAVAAAAETKTATSIKNAREKAAKAAEAAAKAAEAARDRAREAFENLLDSFDLQLERASATRDFQDDLKILRQTEAAIRERIKVEGNTNELQRELLRVFSQRADILRQQAEAQRDIRRATQFEKLGLTAEGAERVPGAGALGRRAASLRDQIKGTALDTGKTRQELDRIKRVLSGKFGEVGRDVRAAILQMLNDIASALKSGTEKVERTSGEITRGGIRSTQKLLKGLGLTPEQADELRRRNLGVERQSRKTAFGFGIGGAPLAGAAGFGGAQGPIIIQLHLDGKEVSNTVVRNVQKRGRRRAASRRGRAGGRNLV